MQPTFVSEFSHQVRLGTGIAMISGVLAGAAAGIAFINLDFADAVLESPAHKLAAVLLLMAVAGLWTATVMVPFAFGLAVARRHNRAVAVSAARYHVLTAGLTMTLSPILVLLWYRWPGTLGLSRGAAALIMVTVIPVAFAVTTILSARSGARSQDPPSWSFIATGSIGLVMLAMITSRVGSSEPEAAPAAGLISPEPVLTHRTANIVLISIDTLRADRLSLHGYERDTSPNLERLASASVVFGQARSQAPWTLPSHASMFTGFYPSTLGVRYRQNSRMTWPRSSDHLSEDRHTLAEALHSAGYRTGAITNNIFVSSRFGLAQGFDSFFEHSHKNARSTVDSAIEWIGQGQEQPFFLFLHFIDVHDYSAPPRFLERYQDATYSGRYASQRFDKHPVISNLLDDLTDADLAYLGARYDGAIRYTDTHIGRFTRWLETAGLFDRTIIVITSDHGEELGEHGGTGHGFTLFDEQLRVPLLIKPDASRTALIGTVSDQVVGVIDITPTLLDMVGLEPSRDFEGRSLVPVLEGLRLERRSIFAEASNLCNSVAVIDDSHKYISRRIPPGCWRRPSMLLVSLRAFATFGSDLLFDLTLDPTEQNSLTGDHGVLEDRFPNSLIDHLAGSDQGRGQVLDSATSKQLRSLGYVN